jgi:glycosyltransferase involved in cell wall biosynthesis
VRVAIVYDCLFPHTIGGAERWHRAVAERLASRHTVTYITRRQWDAGTSPDAPHGTRVIVVSGGRELYTESGRRRLLPPLRFGFGVLRHVLRHRRDYDLIHLDAFPFFSLLAARAAAPRNPPLVVDWFEVWTRDYWTSYLGRAAGLLGWALQRLCVRATRVGFVFSRLHAARLRDEGMRAEPIVLPGLWEGRTEPAADDERAPDPRVLFAGRLIPEKGVLDIPPAIAAARRERPELRATIVGDGPQRAALEELLSEPPLGEGVDFKGFVSAQELEGEMERVLCLLLPSRREGFGLVLVEAASFGTPSIVLAHPDNAAVELIEPGENGILVESAAPEAVAEAILEIAADPLRWRRSTLSWFRRRAPEISVDASVEVIEREYAKLAAPPETRG